MAAGCVLEKPFRNFMPLSHKHWQIADPLPPDIDAALARYDPILRRLLYNRGYTTLEAAEGFLAARPPQTTDPFLLSGMGAAVQRICYAIQHNQPIAVYGDYDVDGVTATALLTSALAALGANVQPYIPNRFEEGYGLNLDALDDIKRSGVQVVVTVENGIRSLAEAQHAHHLGLDHIITDHPHPQDELPNALAVVDPTLPGDPYPEKNLSGVGLAYKLLQALLVGEKAAIQADDFLDLVALGTVADVVPLTGENRSLVRRGLALLQKPYRQGVLSLIQVSGISPARVNASQIGFALGPRINAAGRLDSALAALNLLMTADLFEAGKLAQQLNAQNQERQRLTRQIQLQAEQIALQETPDAWLLFAAHPEFSAGVVGLAASRLTEMYYRPAIVGERGDEFTVASCRSIPEFHITAALDECADLLVRHGGHAAAAGFKVHNDNLAALVSRLQAIATRQLAPLDPRPTLRADMELPLASILPRELLEYQSQLEPTGNQNPEAVFVSRNVQVRSARCVGRESQHLKLAVSDGSVVYDAIAFSFGSLAAEMPKYVDLLYTYEVNEYNGRSTLQLNVRDLKPAQ